GGCLVRVRGRRQAGRRDPCAPAERRGLRALGTAVRGAHAPGGRLRRAGRGLLACGGPRPCACRRANIGLTSFVTRVLNGRGVVNVVTMRRPRGGVMSAFGKSMTAVVAGAALILVAGTLGVSAQGPWVAAPEAKSLKTPVKGVGDAKMLVETNWVTCHGASGHGDGPAAAALPPPKAANLTAGGGQ